MMVSRGGKQIAENWMQLMEGERKNEIPQVARVDATGLPIPASILDPDRLTESVLPGHYESSPFTNFRDAESTAETPTRTDKTRPSEDAPGEAFLTERTDKAAAEVADSDLLDRARAGDLGALGMLLRRHEDRLHRYALKMGQQEADACDAVQGTFVKASLQLHTFRKESGSFHAWLLRIMINTVLVQWRKQHPNVHLASEDLAFQDDDVSMAAEAAERNLIVGAAIETLPEEYQQVICLRYFSNLCNSEIAETLNISESAVTGRLHRARNAIRMELQDQVNRDNI